MSQKDKDSSDKKKWEKPLLVDLDVESTESGGGGTKTDLFNTTTATTSS